MALPLNQILAGNCLEVMKSFPAESIDMVMFSPPYWGLRDYGEGAETVWDGNQNCEHEWSEVIKSKERGSYGESSWHRPGRDREAKWNNQTSNYCVKCGAWKGQLGLEPMWQMYVEHMRMICREIKRVLKKTGSMYIVLGDTYFGGRSYNDYHEKKNFRTKINYEIRKTLTQKDDLYKPKCLMGVPWRVAFALIEDGWILRNDIIWHKPNAMPSSVKDRLTQTYEHIFFFVKSRKYYFDLDAIREPHKTAFAPFNLRVRDVKRGKGGLSVFGELKASKEEVENYVYPENKNLTKHDLAVGRVGNFSYTDPLHFKEYHPKGKNPGDVISERVKYYPHEPRHFQLLAMEGVKHGGHTGKTVRHNHPLGKNPGDVFKVPRDSKFLKADVKTASPAARALKTLESGKLTTSVKKKLFDVGAYLKRKRKESGLSFQELSRLTGIKQTTLEHYFRTDLSGQALPDRKTWELLKPLLRLDEYNNYISEETKNALPQLHPLGRNPGDIVRAHTVRHKSWMSDFWSIPTKPFKGAHFAVYPEEICIKPILSSSPPQGIILDPMCGSGTTLVVAKELGRNYIGIEINPHYVDMARKRLSKIPEKLTKFIE